MFLYLLVVLAACATLLGGWLVVRYLRGRASWLRHLSGFAAGYLLALSLVRVLPESLERSGPSMLYWVLGGFLLVHILEHGLSPHFHYGEETHHHGHPEVAVLALVGLSLHSFMDGMALSAAAQAHVNLETLMFLGILLHRIPEGATISSIFLVRGFHARGATLAAGALALAALIGAATQDLFHIPVGPVLAIAAGLGIYVACADLLPEAQKEGTWKNSIGLAAGMGLFVLSSLLFPHAHEHFHP